MDKIKNWFSDTASIMFDDSRNDFRSLPKTTRMQLLVVMSFLWSLVFSLYVFNVTTFALGFAGVFLGHVLLIILTYFTFRIFYKARNREQTGFEEKRELSPAKIFSIVFIIFFMFIFTKGIDVMTKSNSYQDPSYKGPDTTTEERIKRFVK
jgi:hypothetical protein|tara:strand:- start:235 stop:687 length:453 start_codon:yes stop_codon:yes gene_type:complete